MYLTQSFPIARLGQFTWVQGSNLYKKEVLAVLEVSDDGPVDVQ